MRRGQVGKERGGQPMTQPGCFLYFLSHRSIKPYPFFSSTLRRKSVSSSWKRRKRAGNSFHKATYKSLFVAEFQQDFKAGWKKLEEELKEVPIGNCQHPSTASSPVHLSVRPVDTALLSNEYTEGKWYPHIPPLALTGINYAVITVIWECPFSIRSLPTYMLSLIHSL